MAEDNKNQTSELKKFVRREAEALVAGAILGGLAWYFVDELEDWFNSDDRFWNSDFF